MTPPASERDLAGLLNRELGCLTLDEERLRTALGSALERDLRTTHPTLLAAAPVFVTPDDADAMREVVRAVEAVVRSPGFVTWALEDAPPTARIDRGARGAFLGFDFHLAADGPRLIEINTNAGGGLLGAYLRESQQPCCQTIGDLVGAVDATALEDAFVAMFQDEWRLEREDEPLRSVAIVDEDPRAQFLYPELLLFERLFERRGIRARIADPRELESRDDGLWLDGARIDLVYNRLTDFYLESPGSAALRTAWEHGGVVLTPHARAHALWANKRNLVALSDRERLRAWGVSEPDVETLAAGVPRTVLVDEKSADALWAARRNYFFKPLRGYGSRGTYRGSKLTRRVWSSILESDYVAQEEVLPSERSVAVEGELRPLKLDVRCYVYAGAIQLVGARMYRGQTTNLRTQGGGLASVFTAG